MKKRIIAGLLSFILMISNSITALATTSVADSVSGNSALLQEVDELTLSEAEALEQELTSVSENEPVTDVPSVSENEPPADTSTVSENSLTVSENNIMADTGITAEMEALVKDAKDALAKIVQKKEVYALVYLTEYYDVKAEPNKDSDTVATVPSAKTVQILDVEAEWNYIEEWEEYIPTIWYLVQFYDGEILKEGYIEDSYLAYSDELLIAWQNDFPDLFYKASAISPSGKISLFSTETDYTDVEKFPSSYQIYLKKLKDQYPNWTFVVMDVNRDWSACVDEQMGTDGGGDPFSMIYYNQPEEYRLSQISSTWWRASRAGVEHYMDPRNFLNETYIFQFEQNSFNEEYHSTDALDKYFKGSFMEGKVPDELPEEMEEYGDTYSALFYYVGKQRGISPFFLAAKAMLEQGKTGSPLVSGTYPGYENLYNFFNVGATGTDTTAIVNGLTYARTHGWTTRYKSIYGGASQYGTGYILKGQDTLYLQKFDIDGKGSLHQYMQNIKAPSQDGASVKSMYSTAGSLSSKFVFKIPVFDNMPSLGYEMTSKSSITLNKGQTQQIAIKCNGTKINDLSVFTFVSDTPGVATVSDTGLITAVGSNAGEVGKATITATLKEDTEVSFTVDVSVLCPLSEISLEIEESELYYVEGGLPDKIYYLDESGVTKYYTKADCPTETILTVKYDPADTTDDRTVQWTIEDENVATYEALDEYATSIRVTATGGGTTSVTAMVQNAANAKKPFTATTQISVEVPMTEASVETESISIYKGESARVAVSYSPLNTTERVAPEWKSSKENVVKVEDGMLIATGKGEATVSVAIGPFDGTQDELQIAVTVKEYQVTFLDENGNELVTVPGEYGKSMEYLTEPSEGEIPWVLTKEDHYFAGWYTQENGAGNEVTKDTILYSDMTLYPYFIESSAANADFYAKPLGDVMYTGALRKPSVSVYDAGVLLTKGTDYTVTYKNNKNVYTGTEPDEQPQAVIKGKGEYAGKEITLYFSIVPKEISNIDVTANNMLTQYSGRTQKMQPTVTDAGRTLQKDKDYTLEYTATADGAYVEAGTYEVLITGMGNYTGQRKAYITITKLNLIAHVTVDKIADMPYNNGWTFNPETGAQACVPEPVITYQGNTLVKDEDYILVYSNNTEIGTASIIIIGKGDYTGTKTVTFRIVGNDFSTVKISGVENLEYTGDALEQTNLEVTTKQGQVLKKGNDYRVTYQDNVNVGTAHVVLTGINGYEGTLKKAFMIEPYDIAKNGLMYTPGEDGGESSLLEPAFAVECQTDAVYVKGGAEPEVRVYFKGKRLTEGVDYKLEYRNNDAISDETADENAGNDDLTGANESEKPTVLITGKNRFTGTYEVEFSVSQKDLSAESSGISFEVDNVKFRNRKGFCFVQPIIRDSNGRRLIIGTDYSETLAYYYVGNPESEDGVIQLTNGETRQAGDMVSENDIPMPGAQIKVVATGIGNYTGTISATYEVIENPSWVDALVEIVEKITNTTKTENAGDSEPVSALSADGEVVSLLTVDDEMTSVSAVGRTGALSSRNVAATSSAMLSASSVASGSDLQLTAYASDNSFLAMSDEELEVWHENFESITGYSLRNEVEFPQIDLVFVNRLIGGSEYPLVVRWVLSEG